jgi:cleavage and polyadenylation specificity factor subunit 2
MQGALPYAFAKAGMKAKVYATLPVLKMGQLTLYDIVQSRTDKEDFEVFSLADIDSAWDHFVPLRCVAQPCMQGYSLHVGVSNTYS